MSMVPIIPFFLRSAAPLSVPSRTLPHEVFQCDSDVLAQTWLLSIACFRPFSQRLRAVCPPHGVVQCAALVARL
jgi:hypothetical protein